MESGTIVMIVLLVIILILLIVLMIRQAGRSDGNKETAALRDEILRLQEKVDTGAKADALSMSQLRGEINESLRSGMKTQSEQLLNSSKLQTEALQNLTDRESEALQKVIRENADQKDAVVRTLTEQKNAVVQTLSEQKDAMVHTLSEQRDTMVRTLSESIEKLQKSNEEKLCEMQGIVDTKLDKTLNERLDTNFSKVTEQLGKLYQSLGELKDLSGGVADLNKTLSNVKTRGTWGEVQLSRLLEQTMARSQYDVNVVTKKNSSDRVEFAIKFPSQDVSDEDVYLPIDAKFPSDIYNRIVDASTAGDADALNAAVGALKNRIREEAATIASKYLDPPRTTNYAFMYLPTEGLYSEALRIDGLSEECQKKGVVITGPTTITAVLNSLQVGFRNLALSKKSVEVMKLLEAVKGQVDRMNKAVENTQKKLSDAVSMTDDLHKRTVRLTSRMRSIGDIDEAESDRILGLDQQDDTAEEHDEDGYRTADFK